MVYQDYITGDRQYVLAFGGTDDETFREALTSDWRSNVTQAFGFGGAQYTAAMEIADGLVRNANIPTGHLAVTGHSLGGGLASAAAVVAGAPADTFNASWLNVHTLLSPDGSGAQYDPLYARYEIYPGSLERLYKAQNFVDAYFVDYDILTRAQQGAFLILNKLPVAPVGSTRKLDSPFDGDIAIAGLPSLGTVAADIMFQCHKMNVVLYGLLVTEGFSTIDMLGYTSEDLRK
jgi:hypothetical protein